jgi:HK97 family phage major capsid protein
MNRETAKAAKKLKDSSNQPIYQSGLFGVSPDVLHGRPVLLDDNMPDVAAGAFPVIFGNLSWFYLVIREALAVLPDPYSEKGFVVLDCTRRSGGQVVRPEAFARQKVSA